MSWVKASKNHHFNKTTLLPLVLFLDIIQYRHALAVAANIGKIDMDLVKGSPQFRV